MDTEITHQIDDPDTITTTVRICARCAKDHEAVLFKKFVGNPINGIYDYWAICPETGDPILMRTYLDVMLAELEISDETHITDGYQWWARECPQCHRKTMQVVRIGKVQCSECG